MNGEKSLKVNYVEAPPGLEPGDKGFADPCLTTWLWRQNTNGGSGRNRTADTRIFSPLLYRLSYRAKPIGCGDRTRTCDLRVMSPTSCQLLHPASMELPTRFELVTSSLPWMRSTD